MGVSALTVAGFAATLAAVRSARPLTALAVAQEPLVVLLPSGHPLSGRSGLHLADLADARWIDAPEAAMPLDRLRAASGSDGYRPPCGTRAPTYGA